MLYMRQNSPPHVVHHVGRSTLVVDRRAGCACCSCPRGSRRVLYTQNTYQLPTVRCRLNVGMVADWASVMRTLLCSCWQRRVQVSAVHNHCDSLGRGQRCNIVLHFCL
jgi:hypothetical protein